MNKFMVVLAVFTASLLSWGINTTHAQTESVTTFEFDTDNDGTSEYVVQFSPLGNLMFTVTADLDDAQISSNQPFQARWWADDTFEEFGPYVSAESESTGGLGSLSSDAYTIEGPVEEGIIVIYMAGSSVSTSVTSTSTGSGNNTGITTSGNAINVGGTTIVVNETIVQQINNGLIVVQTESGQGCVGGRCFGGNEAVVVYSTSGGDHLTNFSTTAHGTYQGYHSNATCNHNHVQTVTVVIEVAGAYFFSSPISTPVTGPHCS
jgi:hypothetical protein